MLSACPENGTPKPRPASETTPGPDPEMEPGPPPANLIPAHGGAAGGKTSSGANRKRSKKGQTGQRSRLASSKGKKSVVKHLKNAIRNKKFTIKNLRNQLRLEKEKTQAAKLLGSTSNKLAAHVESFLDLQRRNSKREPNGRRYSRDDIARALALYFQSPRAYRFLRKMYVLPSPRILRKNMERIPLESGFHDTVMQMLKEKFKGASEKERLVVLAFDEMAVKRNMTYVRSSDCVEGYEDLGPLGVSVKPADHALVFMVRGLQHKWKQCLGYFLSAGPVKADAQKTLLLDIIGRLGSIGLTVAATVCDMGPGNQQMYKLLKVEDGTFCVGAHKIAALFDIPHLFKCIRNGLQKHDISADGKRARWEHVRALYEADSTRSMRAAPKLKKAHVFTPPLKKMKVNLATQVMSRSVAAAMHLYASFGKLI